MTANGRATRVDGHGGYLLFNNSEGQSLNRKEREHTSLGRMKDQSAKPTRTTRSEAVQLRVIIFVPFRVGSWSFLIPFRERGEADEQVARGRVQKVQPTCLDPAVDRPLADTRGAGGLIRSEH